MRSPLGLRKTDDFVIDGMPITPQLHRHLRNGTTQSPDLNSCPPSSSGSQQSPLRGNRRVLLYERTPLTGAVWTHPAALSPPKPHRPAKHREVHQPDRPVTLGPHRPARTGRDDRLRTVTQSGPLPSSLTPGRHSQERPTTPRHTDRRYELHANAGENWAHQRHVRLVGKSQAPVAAPQNRPTQLPDKQNRMTPCEGRPGNNYACS